MARVGILALQGAVREHAQMLERCGARPVEVRRPGDLSGVDGLIIPGGESTTIGRLATLYGLMEPMRTLISGGLPTLGTCAGMILLASGVTEGAQPQLEILDMIVQRNAFGRQNESFEVDLSIEGLTEPYHGVFIRSPWVAKVGGSVEVLATVGDHAVMVREGNVLAASFHPELTDDRRLHEMILRLIEDRPAPDTDGER